MHNLALALHKKGYIVSGSDDEIFEPSKSRLEACGLLPAKPGWDAGRITRDIDTVILGMHARADNPELLKALETGLKVVSFPEYIYEQTLNRKRIVVAGSHGKTTTTAMIMHVFRSLGIRFDYMVGSQIDGFDTMTELSEASEYAVLEGDEYLSSAIDRRPKFHLYKPHIAVLNGIAWDHMNVFPTFEEYTNQFSIFIEKMEEDGTLIYFTGDPVVKELCESITLPMKKVPYKVHGYFTNSKGFFAATHNRTVPVKIFGEHNMQNMAAAREACLAAGISEDDFYKTISTFEGSSRRLQLLEENSNGAAYIDFAHSPSKVKATVEAVTERYPGKSVIACLELHTYSSLNAAFLPQYSGTLNRASEAFVYFNPRSVEHKKLPALTVKQVSECFEGKNLSVWNDSQALLKTLNERKFRDPVFLFMSSGDFDGWDLKTISASLLSNK